MSIIEFTDSPRRSSSTAPLLIVILMLLLVITGAGAYFIWEHQKDKQDRAELDAVRMKISGTENRIGLATAEYAAEVLKENNDFQRLNVEREKKIAPLKDELYKLKAQEDLILSRHPDWR